MGKFWKFKKFNIYPIIEDFYLFYKKPCQCLPFLINNRAFFFSYFKPYFFKFFSNSSILTKNKEVKKIKGVKIYEDEKE